MIIILQGGERVNLTGSMLSYVLNCPCSRGPFFIPRFNTSGNGKGTGNSITMDTRKDNWTRKMQEQNVVYQLS